MSALGQKRTLHGVRSMSALCPAAASAAKSIEEQDAYFVVRGRGGQRLAYLYFEDEPGPVFFLFQMQLMKARLRYQIGRSANWLASSSRPRQWSRRSPIPPAPDEAGATPGLIQ
jgi:hypothetical protein